MSERRVIFPAADYFANGRAIWPAYADTGALAMPCGHCGVEPGSPCVKPDGRTSRVPCVDRIAAANLAPTTAITVAVDYSEPRHPQESP